MRSPTKSVRFRRRTLAVSTLLRQNGLDQSGIERIHDEPQKAWKAITEQMAKRASDGFIATPEGQEAIPDAEY
jgi:hypothetical protein